MSEEIGKSLRKVMKVGECLGVTLPKPYWENHDLKAGDYVEVVYNDVLKLTPFHQYNIMRELGEVSEGEEKRVIRELDAEEELERENEDEGEEGS